MIHKHVTKRPTKKEYSDYKREKKKGDAGEQLFISYLKSNGFTKIEHIDDVYKEEGLELSDWDVRGTNDLGLISTFEVKTQQKCDLWNSVNVEQVQFGKPAGIVTSKADYWVFVNDNLGFGFIESEELKKIDYNIRKDPSVRKQSYIDRRKNNVTGIQLWITDKINFAAGYRMPTDRLRWKK